jgi:hypothetical protein
MDSNQVTHELSGREQSEVEAYRVVTTSVDDYLRLLPLDATMRRYDATPSRVRRVCGGGVGGGGVVAKEVWSRGPWSPPHSTMCGGGGERGV